MTEGADRSLAARGGASSRRAYAAHDEHLRALAEEVARVPREPGCYLWKDAKGEVIYVGKAKDLRARMRQYVTLTDDRAKIPLMMQVVEGFDYVVVSSEHEALVLERELIAQYHPYYNVDYKDDKSYPFIAITTPMPMPRARPSTSCARWRPSARRPAWNGSASSATWTAIPTTCPSPTW